MSASYPVLDIVDTLNGDEFRSRYLDRRPVVLRDALADCRAVARWNAAYLRRSAGQQPVKVKQASQGGGSPFCRITLAAFLDRLEVKPASPDTPMPYLHDTPLLTEGSTLLDDLHGLPLDWLPAWYRDRWWRFALFFVGAPGSLTPLHFDSLETHNLFFQISGHKRFIIVPPDAVARCYRRDWRWADVDAERPDLLRFPRFEHIGARECTLGTGDMLYIPPRAFHRFSIGTCKRSTSGLAGH